jgi:hypothetical protein
MAEWLDGAVRSTSVSIRPRFAAGTTRRRGLTVRIGARGNTRSSIGCLRSMHALIAINANPVGRVARGDTAERRRAQADSGHSPPQRGPSRDPPKVTAVFASYSRRVVQAVVVGVEAFLLIANVAREGVTFWDFNPVIGGVLGLIAIEQVRNQEVGYRRQVSAAR